MILRGTVLFLLILGTGLSAHAAEIHVPQDYPTIQGAIDAASDGDTIWVHPGTYKENIDFKGKNIALRSTDGCASTVIDGNHDGTVVTFKNNETSDALIEGFTITNGYNPKGVGGGIWCEAWAYPTIRYNVICNNEAKSGSGIYGLWCDSLIEGNVIEHNTAPYGTAGVSIAPFSLAYIKNNVFRYNQCMQNGSALEIVEWNGAEVLNNVFENNTGSIATIFWYINSYKNGYFIGNIVSDNMTDDIGGLHAGHVPVIKNNFIINNRATSSAGGLALIKAKQNPCYIQNNFICGNRSGTAGGILALEGLYYLINNTISGNHADSWGGGIYIAPGSNLVIRNSIIWGNHAGLSGDEIYGYTSPDIQYSDIGGGWPGPGNIDADPLFVDPANGDYHLQAGSPCIDAGTTRVPGGLPGKDIEGDPRIVGAGVDMGADEFGTHLYFMGVPAPGSLVTLKIIGPPGSSPVGIFVSPECLAYPLVTQYGFWYLASPVFGPILLGPIPSNGVITFYGILPPDIPGPYTLNFQALVVDKTTNLTIMEVE